ncbi:MAG: phosphoribosyltransferase family protein [Pseudomonadota bacterium]|nr:phosphoribosyltransferase family protein [Pseudomonadota bacterium]
MLEVVSCLGIDRCVACASCPPVAARGALDGHLCHTCLDGIPDRLQRLPVLPPGITSGWYLGSYAGPVGAMVRAGKYEGNEAILWALGRHCGRHLDVNAVDSVVAVPSSPWRRLVRGINPADLLAYPVAAHQGIPLFHPLVRRRAQSQARVGRVLRAGNARGAYRVTCPVQGRVLLVDDVVTTGSTARACAEELLAAGADEVHLLVIAASPGGIVPES